jgi:hypothetical protein
MESQDLLHPEVENNQQVEVNPGAVSQPEIITESETQTEVGTAENMQSSAQETKSIEDPTNHADVQTVSDMMSEIENGNSTQTSDVDEEDEKPQETIEAVEAEYQKLTLEQQLEELNAVVANSDVMAIKTRVGVLKSKITEQIKQIKKEQQAKFLAENENGEEYVPEQLEAEKILTSALSVYKANKAKYIDQIEQEKQRNLEVKQNIILSLKNLVEEESNLKVLNDKFKELQEQWRNVGPVPQNESTNLWQNYHFYVEKFFDILRMNREMRDLDLKKNLELKIKLCEDAESLLLQESINKSFKDLQKLHEEWKELGPVPEDKKEEIWERFKNASDQINQRRREHYETILSEQQSNYNAKLVLCQQAEELVAKECNSIKENNEISDQLTELLKVWKTLGPAPAKLNDEIWDRFKSTLDKFFQAKKEYFQQMKEDQLQNYNMKVDLAIRAEGIAKRTDWKQATEEILELQKEWKNIGAVPKKHSDAVWKRFRAACDLFFEAKSNYFANIQTIEAENLAKKEDLIQRIANHQFTEDKSENLEAMKAYQREWTELGHVPKKEKDRIYNEYKSAVNKKFEELKVSAEEVKRGNFQNKLDNILSGPNADKVLDKEKRFLVNKLAQLKEDISLWENNLGFFANSKNADLLKAEFAKKIEMAKHEVKELEYKIKMMNSTK